MEGLHYYIYPEHGSMTDDQLLMKAKDAIANGLANHEDFDGSIKAAKALLEDVGEFTFVSEGEVPALSTTEALDRWERLPDDSY